MTLAEARNLLFAMRHAEEGVNPAARWAAELQADDPVGDRIRLDRLAQWCQRFTPLVAVETSDRPESLSLDITGCDHLWHGEEQFGRAILAELAQYGLMARVAVADTWGAAWAVAHYAGHPPSSTFPRSLWIDSIFSEVFITPPGHAREAISSLPIEALRLEPSAAETLQELGIHRIDQLESLSRSSLSSRFDRALLLRLDQALGRAKEILIPKDFAPQLEETWPLEYPTGSVDFVLDIVHRLLEKLLPQVPIGDGVVRFEVMLRGYAEATGSREREAVRRKILCPPHSRVPAPPPPLSLFPRRSLACANKRRECSSTRQLSDSLCLPFGLCRPSVRAKHLLELVRLALERTRLEAPVMEIQLRITATAPLELLGGELFDVGSRQGERRELETLIDRLTSRLGRKSVLVPRPVADPLPERSVSFVPAVDSGRRAVGSGDPNRRKGRQDSRPTVRSRARRQAVERGNDGSLLPPSPASVHLCSPSLPLPLSPLVLRRPLRLRRRPEPIDVLTETSRGEPTSIQQQGRQERIAYSWGPERMQTGWWRGKAMGRDYYRIETAAGRWLWIFRDLFTKRWFLHGAFD